MCRWDTCTVVTCDTERVWPCCERTLCRCCFNRTCTAYPVSQWVQIITYITFLVKSVSRGNEMGSVVPVRGTRLGLKKSCPCSPEGAPIGSNRRADLTRTSFRVSVFTIRWNYFKLLPKWIRFCHLLDNGSQDRIHSFGVAVKNRAEWYEAGDVFEIRRIVWGFIWQRDLLEYPDP